MRRRLKITGKRGRWLAEVEGRMLPVVHHTDDDEASRVRGRYGDHTPETSAHCEEPIEALPRDVLLVMQRAVDAGKMARNGDVRLFHFSDIKLFPGGDDLALAERHADPRQ